jgi:ABC-type multidrug transport system fused ATPase/permease subunit
MALHITNCFLEMSGHETYNCELDKKPNLRGICISSMSDRAFNVYTEFYTHVQNICWFLRGQIWHETISESSFKVGKQLEVSAKNQEELLGVQKESMEVQRKILQHEKRLEEVLGDLYLSARAHQEVLSVLTRSVAKFQTWVIGEVSWLDSVIFYVVAVLFIFIFTSLKRTANARLPLLLLLFANFLVERFICFFFITEDSLIDTKLLYQDIYSYVWYSRDLFILSIILYLVYCSYNYKDIILENNKFLQSISKQNSKILEMLHSIINNNNNNEQNSPKSDTFSFVNESLYCNGFAKKLNIDLDESSTSTYTETIKGRKTYVSRTHLPLNDRYGSRYNLRSSKQNTPELN